MLSSVIFCFYFLTTQDVCNTYRQIVSNHPLIDKVHAKNISELVVKYSRKYKINPRIYAAILMQESSYRLNVKNRLSNDYGIAQINKTTAKAYGFSTRRLLSDLEYSIEAGAKVLSDFRRMYSHKEGFWYWTRYNTSKPSKRASYKRKVERYL